MVNNGSKAGVSAAPPRELHVWKFVESRASELEGLHTIVAGRLDNSFRSQRNKRRRTTGHDDRVAKGKHTKRRKVRAGNILETDTGREDGKKVPRRVRRNIELKKNLRSGFGTSGDGTKRLRTHVWHAKRFTMKKLWGFYIPLGLHGRGRGSRALLRKLKHGVLVHDASYFGSVQLEGPEDTLMSVLSSVLVPSPPACCKETWNDILAGTVFGTAMLHHAGKPGFPPISPVTYMWRSLQPISANMGSLNKDTCNSEQNVHDGTIIRQLWVWVHAADFEEAYDSLSSACERQTDMTRSARCVSREGQLAKLELVGSKLFELLQKTLVPTSCNSGNTLHLKNCSADEHDDPGDSGKTIIFENGHQISFAAAVVSMVVKDPRECINKGNVIAPEEKPRCDLWDASEGVCPPLEESVLCNEKHHQLKEFIRLGHTSFGPENASPDGTYSRVCPILLLKYEANENSVTRCSIILPLSWAKAFWITFVSNGAHAVGLREKHWVACELGLPYFPLDFPDCNAYSTMEAVEINQKANLRPLSKRPLEVPTQPPWDCLHLTLASKAGNSHSKAELDAQNRKQEKILNCGESQSDSYGNTFEGIIARTSRILMSNLNGNRLLLFPRKSVQENSLYKFMRDEEFLKQDTIMSQVLYGNTPCYIRVHLHAYKEGVFEQGALVCAPLPADIMLLKASDDRRLQIPQSSLKSYFMKLPSGKWELHMPDDDQALHRCPIGFITTGFVRGSKKATAGALCEASLLSILREEQWKAVQHVRQRKKEIYVLVRNMRSTAYRLALATIVLEQNQNDVDFM